MPKITIIHHPLRGQIWGPGQENQITRDAYDAQQLEQGDREKEAENEAEIS